MITTLHIKNIGIMDDVTIDLNTGFNVLTGETGAGKTLLIDSLCIISGGRFSKEMIRRGQDHSFVELCLYLPHKEESVDGTIIVSREIYANGRNQCKINGRLVTVNELRNFMATIIDIHGQYDNQSLLDTSTHVDYLDPFAGQHLLELTHQYHILYDSYLNLKEELKKNYGDEKEKQRKLDLLKYQLKEIEAAKLKTGEDEELEQQRKVMLNSEKITQNLIEADTQISDVSLDAISNAIHNLEKIESLNEKYSSCLSVLRTNYYDLQEASRDLSQWKDETYFNEAEREKIENRLDSIFSLKRKYGNTIEEILHYAEELAKEIFEIENLEEYTNDLKKKLSALSKEMLVSCQKMHEIRKQYALQLEKYINTELVDLEMKHASFSIQINFSETQDFTRNGLDFIEFLIATNKGETAKPLTKIASGGEMSRIMLAIKTVLANVDEVPILVFDEIDTGISGKAALAVSNKLKTISRKASSIMCYSFSKHCSNGRL